MRLAENFRAGLSSVGGRGLVGFSLACAAALGVSAQTTVSVSGLANIYGSGFADAPGPGGFGGGATAVEYPLPNGTTSLKFTSVIGTISFDSSSFSGADGSTSWGALTQLSDYRSLSGITYSGRTAFLIGVFLDASTPTGAAPATLSYDTTSAGLSTFSPLLRQVFFTGDGLDTSSGLQVFNVPTGATRLFLGFADAWNGSSVTGLPGAYQDNAGSLSVTISPIPEPETLALWLGLGAIATAVWRRRA